MGSPIKPDRVPPPIEDGEPARPAFFETAEFKAAVQAAASEAAKKAAADVAEALRAANPAVGSDTQAILEGLALAIAQISHQGDKRDAPVDPKVLAERAAGMERMHALILEAKALPRGDPRRPLYKTRSKQNLNDTMIDPWRRDPATKKAVPVTFRWALEPNDAMVPLNELAEKIMAEFRASRGNQKEYAKQAERQAWLTDGGLLIEGAAPARREVSQSLEPTGDLDVDLGEGPNDPNATHVRVLGTSHPPARQNIGAGAAI
jgi:hypothetical protein